jgi:biopolymer transport protein TolR
MDAGGAKKGIRGEINVTPLIDVVLVLLIIFMVLTPSMLKHLDPTIPKKADETVVPSAETPILVEYTDNRVLTVNGEPIRPEQLADSLAGRLRLDRQKVVFFKAADEAPYGEVVRLMDIARGAGAKTLAVVTKE